MDPRDASASKKIGEKKPGQDFASKKQLVESSLLKPSLSSLYPYIRWQVSGASGLFCIGLQRGRVQNKTP